jgi:signal transduction histidine kinase
MRLVDKFTIWFIAITTLVLVAGGLIVFKSVQHEIDQEAIRRIKSHIDNVAKELEQGKSALELQSEHVVITEIDADAPLIELEVYDTMAVYRPRMEALDRKLTVESSYVIDGKHYLISMYDFVAEPDEIADGVRESLVWIFVILLIIVGITNLMISKRILAPFHKTLKAIENFSLKKEVEIKLPETRTKEFSQLNFFLKKMTDKAQRDYRSLKEFTENASHELQTPLAVIRGKLELMLESDISDEQAGHILAALNSLEKLSKINHSLTLLSKLGNQEFATLKPINFSQHVETVTNDLIELMEMKSITLKKDIQKNVKVLIHPSLADILLMNLFSNAIRHNYENGTIEVQLTATKLVIQNTGMPPEVPVEHAFERFKRTTRNEDSVGLGLAIVKQICDVSSLSVSYRFEQDRHVIEIVF